MSEPLPSDRAPRRGTHDAIVDSCVEMAIGDDRVRAFWIEADSVERLRRPYDNGIELHFAADEPAFPALVNELTSLISKRFRVEKASVTDTQRNAKQFHLQLHELADERMPDSGESRGSGGDRPDGSAIGVRLIVEQTSLLAKRPRAHVVALVDKTTHLTHVMDFSARAKKG